MNVFVLCTGRCGSTTFQAACGHIGNYTSGHESLRRHPEARTLPYPANHIEVDNRLAWQLGALGEKYGDDARYVHLTRDRDQVAESFNKRWTWAGSLSLAFKNGIRMSPRAEPDIAFCYDLVDTVNANIREFLRHRRHVMTFDVATADNDFSRFWEWIGAEGDRDAALGEWQILHNASKVE